MDADTAWQKIVELTLGNCFGRDGLRYEHREKEIGLSGRFTSAQLKEIVQLMEEVK